MKRFYTTCATEKEYVDAAKALDVVDSFCEEVNLDGLLHDMAIRLIACGNDFWLKPRHPRSFQNLFECQLIQLRKSSYQVLRA